MDAMNKVKDLGVQVTSDCKWGDQCVVTGEKAGEWLFYCQQYRAKVQRFSFLCTGLSLDRI